RSPTIQSVTMRFVLLVLLVLPFSIALQCYYSGTVNGEDISGLGVVKGTCPKGADKFCMTWTSDNRPGSPYGEQTAQQRGCDGDEDNGFSTVCT
ncbi:hypothetical protein PENTCL1PPCAC_20693, partial [Pristionchus entomophagus]